MISKHATMADTIPADTARTDRVAGVWIVVCRDCDWKREAAYARHPDGMEEAWALSLAHRVGTVHEVKSMSGRGARR